MKAIQAFFDCSAHTTLVIVGSGGSGKSFATNLAILTQGHPPLTVRHSRVDVPHVVKASNRPDTNPKTIYCLDPSDTTTLSSFLCGYNTRSKDRLRIIAFSRGTEAEQAPPRVVRTCPINM